MERPFREESWMDWRGWAVRKKGMSRRKKRIGFFIGKIVLETISKFVDAPSKVNKKVPRSHLVLSLVKQ
jgi:hypothetical protein